jgi:hypothetical protein
MKHGKIQGKTGAKRGTHVTSVTASNCVRPSVLKGTGAESIVSENYWAYLFKD